MGDTVSNSASDLPPLAETIARLHRAVAREIAVIEAAREKLGDAPRQRIEAGRDARTLASLAATLDRLNRMQMGLPPSADDYDDIPADIDDFRRRLTRRIEAFLESREAAEDGGGDAAPGAPSSGA